MLFATPKPITVKELVKITGSPSVEIEAVLMEIDKDFKEKGFVLIRNHYGYQFRTKEEFAPWLRKIAGVKKIKLSNAAMEVLAIVAYKQPIT